MILPVCCGDVEQVYNQNGWCQFFVYMMYVVSFLSVWFVTAFTIERYLIIRFPLRRHKICRPNRAKIVVFSITGLSLALYSFAIWTSEVAPAYPYDYQLCQVSRATFKVCIARVDSRTLIE